MTTSLLDANKTLAQRYRAEFWNGRLETADEILAPNCVLHVSDSFTPAAAPGIASFKQVATMYLSAFPDAQQGVEDVVIEATKAAVRWRASGTQQGDLGRLAATGKTVNVTGIDLLHIQGGKITDIWTNWDVLGMLQQLGFAPQ